MKPATRISPTRRRVQATGRLWIAAWLSGLLLLAMAGCAAGSRAAGARPGETALPASPTGCADASEAAVCAPSGLASASPTPAGPGMVQPGPALAPSPTLASSPFLPTLANELTPTVPIPTPSPTTCPAELCIFSNSLPLARPVVPPGRDTIDTSYRFGTTQGGQRDPHHGVEFLNSFGTPVLAAVDGEVVVAGDDRKTFYGLYSYFYGNLVVLKHDLPGLEEPLFTLYGHLSKIEVTLGDQVRAGQEIGQVGMSGIATGSHLHFEVRLGENSYQNSRNPELWLAPLAGLDGQPMGALVGRITDGQGNGLPLESIVLEHLNAPGGPADFTLYLSTYAEKALLGQPPYRENFAAGDLPAGLYRLSFVHAGMQSRTVEVRPGQVTLVTFQFDQ